MIRAQLDAASLARVRLAPSPLLETVFWLGLTVSGRPHPVFGAPGPKARFALRDPDVAATAALAADWVTQRYVPDFLTPPPAPLEAGRVLDDQLERVRGTSPVEAHGQLVGPRWTPATVDRLGLGDGRLPAVAAAGLAKFWRIVLADEWSGLVRLTAAPIARQAELAARSGLGASFNALHRDLTWQHDSLWLGCRNPALRSVDLRGTELVLVPSLLTLPHLSAQLDSGPGTFVCFPVAPERARRPAQDEGGRRLLGRGRSEVLHALDEPSTTRAVAHRVGLSESTVSHHLQVLLRSGLVDRTREGREVTYALTPSGRRLLDAVRPVP